MAKNNFIKNGKPPPEKPEDNTLEKEIDEMIDREKTRGKIVKNCSIKWFHQP